MVFTEVLWYLFFISSGLLALVCIAILVLNLLNRMSESNKSGEDEGISSLTKKQEIEKGETL